VAFLKVKRARLEKKDLPLHPGLDVPSPPVLDDMDENVYKAVLNADPGPPLPTTLPTTHLHGRNGSLPHIRRCGPWVVVGNVESTTHANSVEEEVRNCFEIIQGE
jgi:hypothetical protein